MRLPHRLHFLASPLLALALLVGVAACDDGGGGSRDAAPDLVFPDTCAGTAVEYGPTACSDVGKTFTCSTWEHDLCCVCAPTGSGPQWRCLGPHVFQCSLADLKDGGA